MLKKYLSRIRKKANSILQKKALNSYTWSNIYYVFDSSFSRTHHSLLNGIHTYKKRGQKNYTYLKRNIHRIEKGLIHPNKKEIFAKSFIVETITNYKNLHLELDASTRAFYDGVFKEYFRHVSEVNDNEIQKALSIFESIPINRSSNKYPYKRENSTFSSIKYEDFLNLCKQRRSVRYFLDKKVAPELIDKALFAALQAPSACNRQPFRIIASQEESFKNKMGKIPMGADTFYENVPMFMAVIGDLSNYEFERDKNLIYIDGSLFVMSFLLALETLGLSACTINWPDIESKEKELSSLLGLKPYERCVMFIAVGYADPNGFIPYSEKKLPQEIITYIP